MDDASNVSAELQAAMVKAMLHPLRGRILTAICERPQLTVRQLSARIDEPPRRIRRQLQALIDSGLVMVDHETSRRNARERHYRSAVRRISIGDEDLATVEDGRAAATTVLRVLVDDIRGAIGDLTFGTHEGHAEVRIPGWVDERGWNELAALFWRAMEEIEATMVESARRLRDGDGPGIEAICALLLFLTPPWEGAAQGATPPAWTSVWAEEGEEPDPDRSAEPAVPDALRPALIEALGHPLRGRILIVIWERVGVTVKEICRRLDESPRKVRHHVERLMAAGLVELDPKASAGEPRERHYRATVRRILIEDDDDVEEKDRRAAATTVLRTMTEDLRAAIADRTFGTREGHAEVRIPGQVDQEGWERIGTILRMAIVEIEQTMVEGARRLRAAEDPGIEVNTALLLFEAPAWGEEGSRPGDTFGRSLWLGDPPPS